MPHKMDSDKAECMHGDKAHGPLGKNLATGQPYICRTCGHEGSEAVISMASNDYHSLRLRKDQGGFGGPR